MLKGVFFLSTKFLSKRGNFESVKEYLVQKSWRGSKSNHSEQSRPIYPHPVDHKAFPGKQSSLASY